MGKYIFSAVIIIAAILTVSIKSSEKATDSGISKNGIVSKTVLNEQNKSLNSDYQFYAYATTIKKPRR